MEQAAKIKKNQKIKNNASKISKIHIFLFYQQEYDTLQKTFKHPLNKNFPEFRKIFNLKVNFFNF